MSFLVDLKSFEEYYQTPGAKIATKQGRLLPKPVLFFGLLTPGVATTRWFQPSASAVPATSLFKALVPTVFSKNILEKYPKLEYRSGELNRVLSLESTIQSLKSGEESPFSGAQSDDVACFWTTMAGLHESPPSCVDFTRLHFLSKLTFSLNFHHKNATISQRLFEQDRFRYVVLPKLSGDTRASPAPTGGEDENSLALSSFVLYDVERFTVRANFSDIANVPLSLYVEADYSQRPGEVGRGRRAPALRGDSRRRRR